MKAPFRQRIGRRSRGDEKVLDRGENHKQDFIWRNRLKNPHFGGFFKIPSRTGERAARDDIIFAALSCRGRRGMRLRRFDAFFQIGRRAPAPALSAFGKPDAEGRAVYAPSSNILSAISAMNSPLVGFSFAAYTRMPKI